MGRASRRKKEVQELTKPVQRQHIWKPGDHPEDPDAYPESGWEYAHIVPFDSDPTNKTDRHTLGGGPESGMPCVHCGTMTRMVEEISPKDLLELSFKINTTQLEQVENKTLTLLICPACQAMTHFRTELLQPMREAWLAKQG